MHVVDNRMKRTLLGGARARLDWRDPEHHLGSGRARRGAIARTLAYLFGFGGLLLLVTLALPGSPSATAPPWRRSP